MAFEAIIYPQGQLGNLGYDYNIMQQEDHIFGDLIVGTYHQESASIHACYGDPNSSPEVCTAAGDYGSIHLSPPPAAATTTSALGVGRRSKRRRTKNGKNKEEMENQRMTHITVERNRRKQMNEYLAVIRSLMPSSYAQRGDQASIVGGAINFVKELEQHLQTLEIQKRPNIIGYSPPSPLSPLFGDFFAFPQYSIHRDTDGGGGLKNQARAMADIEVTMVESHANLKILSKKRQRQLLKMVAGLKCLLLTILHLNVTTIEQMVLYTLSVKLDDGCQLSTVDEIADEVNCLLCRIEEESLCLN